MSDPLRRYHNMSDPLRRYHNMSDPLRRYHAIIQKWINRKIIIRFSFGRLFIIWFMTPILGTCKPFAKCIHIYIHMYDCTMTIATLILIHYFSSQGIGWLPVGSDIRWYDIICIWQHTSTPRIQPGKQWVLVWYSNEYLSGITMSTCLA